MRILKTQIYNREFNILKGGVDKAARTAEIAFSSETPVWRGWGFEILDHAPGSVRLDRLNDSAPLLLGHNMDDQIGVIVPGSGILGADKVGRAVVRFSRSERAENIFQDVLDEIRTKISVGYAIHRMILEDETEGSETYRALDWEPMEISVVAVPADNSVGVGRSFSDVQTIIEEKGEKKCSVNLQCIKSNGDFSRLTTELLKAALLS